MRLPEKMTFSLPPSDASFMKVKAELVDESANEIILETEQLKVPLSLVRITICFLFFFRFLWENGTIALMVGE